MSSEKLEDIFGASPVPKDKDSRDLLTTGHMI